MKLFALVVAALLCALSQAFAPLPRPTTTTGMTFVRPGALKTRTYINIGEQERDKLTRDSEPEDFFAT